jgi:hypothetical protein
VSKVLKGMGPGRRQHIKDVTFTLQDLGCDNTHPGRGATLLAQCNLKKLKVFVNSKSVRTLFTHNLLRAAGVKKLREIRGCEEVHVEQSPLINYSSYEPKFTDEDIKEFEDVLREELCQQREQARDVLKEIVVEEEDE